MSGIPGRPRDRAKGISVAARELACRAGLTGATRAPVVVVTVIVLAGVGLYVARGGWSHSEPGFVRSADASPSAGVARSVETTGPHADTPTRPEVVVHIAGAVLRPGVYTLSGDARVADGVEAAGGLLGDAVASAINLARPLDDGEQVYVPTLDEHETGVGSSAGSSRAAQDPASGSALDLNSADAAELEGLPGIGPATAEKIVADREQNGAFQSVEELTRVSGIGPKKLEALRELVVVR